MLGLRDNLRNVDSIKTVDLLRVSPNLSSQTKNIYILVSRTGMVPEGTAHITETIKVSYNKVP